MCTTNTRALQIVESHQPGREKLEYFGEHEEHGKDGKPSTHDLKHSIYHSKHSICQRYDLLIYLLIEYNR